MTKCKGKSCGSKCVESRKRWSGARKADAPLNEPAHFLRETAQIVRELSQDQSLSGIRFTRTQGCSEPLNRIEVTTYHLMLHACTLSVSGIPRTGSPPTLSGVISVCAAIGTSVDQSSASGSRTPSRPRSPQPGVSVREHGAPATAPICGRAGDVSGRARRRLAAFLHVNTPSAKRDVAAAPTSPAVSPTASSAANQPATRSQNVREPCGRYALTPCTPLPYTRPSRCPRTRRV